VAGTENAGLLPVTFSSWDDGDALIQSELCVQASPATVQGVLVFDARQAGEVADIAVVLGQTDGTLSRQDAFVAPDGAAYRGQLQSRGKPHPASAEIVFADVEPQLALRRAGILETTILKDKTVLCIGLGTGGAHVAVELAKCGVGRFLLVDRDRLSVGNVVRHPGGSPRWGDPK
jgi:hypothetical protein